jgi:hypothetical protein
MINTVTAYHPYQKKSTFSTNDEEPPSQEEQKNFLKYLSNLHSQNRTKNRTIDEGIK